jgi:hypothetical protein
MKGAALRLTLYDARPGHAGLVLPGSGVWFVYAPGGELTLGPGGETRIGPDDGRFAGPGARLAGAGPAWLYEVAPASEPFFEPADLLRSQVLALRFGPPYLVRADRIESPPGAVTPRHGHRGPGMRRLVFGRLRAEVGEAVERIEAGQWWFETGTDMVVGTNTGETNAAFVRVMVLPAELEGGKSSFVPADAAEAAKPRTMDLRLFGETDWNGGALRAR